MTLGILLKLNSIFCLLQISNDPQPKKSAHLSGSPCSSVAQQSPQFGKRKRRDSTYLENPKWTASQQAAFIICVFIIICSYSALITYVFNITKPVDLMQDLKLEFLEIYDTVFYSVDHWSDHIFDTFCKGVHYLCPFVL